MRRNFFICLLLAGMTLAAFWPVGRLGFIKYDDYGPAGYIVDNPNIQKGINADSIRWAFTTTQASNWHPITWLSHILDCQLFGLNAGGHHWVNLGFHIANTLLLFMVLFQMTQAPWRSALVAALFGLHPLHVQSVAWVSERKDLLSGFFMMLTLWAWARYARGEGNNEGKHSTANSEQRTANAEQRTSETARRGLTRPTLTALQRTSNSQWCYWLALFCFALGLMSKPMLVTLPVILLLLDYWPLKRVTSDGWRVTRFGLPAPQLTGLRRLIWEKAPFAALSLASGIVTVWAQGTSVVPLDYVAWDWRVENSLAAYAAYLGKLFWPQHLAIFYPYVQVPAWEFVGSGLLLVLASVFCIRRMAVQPWLLVGWLWFVVMLLPVIGLVQVSVQSMADRYMYLPSIGLFIIAAWGLGGLAAVSRVWRAGVALGAAALLLACLLETRHQLSYWRDSVTLFSRAIEVTGENPMGDYFLANACQSAGDLEGAARNYRFVLRTAPDSEDIHYRLGRILLLEEKWPEAGVEMGEVLRLNPDNAFAHKFLGDTLAARGKYAEAGAEYATALQLRPGDTVITEAQARLAKKIETARAIASLEESLRLKPDAPDVLNNLAWLLATGADANFRDGKRAVELAERACELTGYRLTPLVGTLAAAYAEAGRFDDAMAAAKKACALATESGDQELLKKNQELLALYQRRQPYHETAKP